MTVQKPSLLGSKVQALPPQPSTGTSQLAGQAFLSYLFRCTNRPRGGSDLPANEGPEGLNPTPPASQVQ